MRCSICLLLFTLVCRVSTQDTIFPTVTPLPFPPCRASDLACLRRGLRTFFFLMEEHHLGMASVDPSHVASVALAYPDIGMRYIMRSINVTGARWTQLLDRRINNISQVNTAIFSNDFHVSSYLQIQLPIQTQSYHTYIVMDMLTVQSSITYPWWLWKGADDETYVVIGEEEITVLKPQEISFYLENSEDEPLLRNALENRPSILEHLAKEITSIVMEKVVNNFRIFAKSVPFQFYYKVWKS